MYPPTITETIANVSTSVIAWSIVAATCMRIFVIRNRPRGARVVSELLESFIVAIVLVFLVIRPFAIQAYFIPSPSMEPTLIGKNGVGDRILVNKLVYRFTKPQRNDVVVFVPPPAATEGSSIEAAGQVNYIKRLIGRPGDVIEAHAGRLIVNGTAFSHAMVRRELADNAYFGEEGLNEPDLQADHHVKFVADGVMVDGARIPNAELGRIFANDAAAAIKVVPGFIARNGVALHEPFVAEDPDYDLKIWHGEPLKFDQSAQPRLAGVPISQKDYDTAASAKPEPIPEGKLFMMGDNRNDSKDSTEWGPLDERRVIGKAEWVFWPLKRMAAITR